MHRPIHFETITVHAGHELDPATGAIAPPIYLSTTFEREPDLSYRAGFIYSRYANPTRRSLERCLATLEGGGAAACFSSGSAATAAVLQSLPPESHVILPDDAYYGTLKLARDVLSASRLRLSRVDMTDIAQVEQAITKDTRVVWVESPSNPLVRVVDIERIAQLARNAGAWVVVDNTWATPLLQQPFRLGADLIMHSTTKYLGGHSDILGGALVGPNEQHPLFAKCRAVQGYGGAVPSPFDCWLTLRGVQTLAVRVRVQTENAQRIATFLAAHNEVEMVHYPGLRSHPGFEIAQRQMSAPGAMLSLQVRGGRDAAIGMTNRLKLITRATSLGGTETLIEHRHSVEGAETRAPENLLRMSVGLEHVDDLIADLEEALQ